MTTPCRSVERGHDDVVECPLLSEARGGSATSSSAVRGTRGIHREAIWSSAPRTRIGDFSPRPFLLTSCFLIISQNNFLAQEQQKRAATGASLGTISHAGETPSRHYLDLRRKKDLGIIPLFVYYTGTTATTSGRLNVLATGVGPLNSLLHRHGQNTLSLLYGHVCYFCPCLGCLEVACAPQRDAGAQLFTLRRDGVPFEANRGGTPPAPGDSFAQIEHQDVHLSEIGQSASRLGNISLEISKELDQQNKMLDNVNTDLEEAIGGLDVVTKKTKDLIKKSGGLRNFMVILILVVILAVLVFLVIYT